MAPSSSAVSPSRTVIRIFVASPSDVEPERRVIVEVVRRHNERYGVHHGYVLDAELFEHRTAPAVGAPEAVIYKQMGHPSDYHIVVGILFSTVGTPDDTDRHRRSGTQQELDDAIVASRANGRPEVMLYLKKPTGYSVEAYASTLRGQLLRCRFSSTDEFQQLFEEHLLLKAYKYILPLVREANSHDPAQMLRVRMDQYWFSDKEAFRDVLRPAEVPMRLIARGMTVLESTISVGDVFEHVMQGVVRVVITGRPGSGKAFTLFALIQLGMRSPKAIRVPVYLAATDWLPRAGGHARSMEEWLADELHSTYKLKKSGKDSAQTLVDNLEVMPFIDGMDKLLEVDDEDRERRYFEFKVMLAEWSRQNPVVMTCETATWTERAKDLQDEFTVVDMLPVEDAAGLLADRPELQGIVQGNEVMKELCRAPLAISLLRRLDDAHALQLRRELPAVRSTAEGLRLLLQNAFEIRAKTVYPRGVRLRALIAIARRLQPGGSFEIEKLQPGDYGVEWRYRIYAGLGLALAVFLLVALPSFLSLDVERHLAATHVPPGYLTDHPVLESIDGGALAGAVGGLLIFLGMLVSRGWLTFGLAVGAAFGCARGVVLGVGLTDDFRTISGLHHGLRIAGITSAVFIALMWVIFRVQKLSPIHIRPFDVSVGDVRRQFVPAAYVAVPAGLLVGVLFYAFFGLARGISFAVMVAVAVETIIVVASRPAPRKVRPNQGIRVSLEASVKIGVAALIVGPICFGLGYLTISVDSAYVNAILGMNVGLIVLLCGGLPVVQHFALRAVLHHRKLLPFRMVDFCEECVRLGVLNRAGHRYQFVDDHVRSYFSEMKASSK